MHQTIVDDYIFYLLLMRSRKKKGGKRSEEAGKKKEEVRWKEKKMGSFILAGEHGVGGEKILYRGKHGVGV